MKVKLSQHLAGGAPGDVVDVSEAQARGLLLEGYATEVDRAEVDRAEVEHANASAHSNDEDDAKSTTRRARTRRATRTDAD